MGQKEADRHTYAWIIAVAGNSPQNLLVEEKNQGGTSRKTRGEHNNGSASPRTFSFPADIHRQAPSQPKLWTHFILHRSAKEGEDQGACRRGKEKQFERTLLYRSPLCTPGTSQGSGHRATCGIEALQGPILCADPAVGGLTSCPDPDSPSNSRISEIQKLLDVTDA